MVVTIRPIATGNKLRLASSNGLTLQIAAAGMSAHGIRVPPPIKDILFSCNNGYFSSLFTAPIIILCINDYLFEDGGH